MGRETTAWLIASCAKAARDRVVALEGGLGDLADVELRAADPAPHYDRRELEAAIAHLPEPSRRSLLLADLWGLDHEVATALDERAAPIEAPCLLAAVSTLGGTLGDRRCRDAVAVAVTSGSRGFPTSSRNGTPRGAGPCCLQTSGRAHTRKCDGDAREAPITSGALR
jgi:hypothetical protein